MSQVLNNLIGNALKYSPAGGRVRVGVSRDAGEAVINVSDEGIGIPPEEVARIFEPFRRVPGVADTIPGTGLGLSVARRIVEAHGGSIGVTSQPGVGSTFSVRLPTPAVT
jgi:signal transduction histidine kinase